MAPLKILFTSRARKEMREVLDFISQDNPGAAARLAGEIMTALEHKAEYPMSGRVIPERPDHPARELVLPPCRIFYLADDSSLHVLSVMRAERLLRIRQLEN